MDIRTLCLERVSLDAPRSRGGTRQLRYGAEKSLRFQTPVWKVRYTDHRALQRLAADHRWFDDLVHQVSMALGEMAGLDRERYVPPRNVPLSGDCVFFDREGTYLDESPLHSACDYALALLVAVTGVWESGAGWGVRWEALQVRLVDTLYEPAPKVYIEGVEVCLRSGSRGAPMFLSDD